MIKNFNKIIFDDPKSDLCKERAKMAVEEAKSLLIPGRTFFLIAANEKGDLKVTMAISEEESIQFANCLRAASEKLVLSYINAKLNNPEEPTEQP